MFVPNELPVKNVAELVELARQQPGKLNYAGYVGGVPQFLGEMLNRAAKINTGDGALQEHDRRAGRLAGQPHPGLVHARRVGHSGPERQAGPHDRRHRRHAASVLPDVPTFKEAGYPDLTVDVAYFLLAAKGTPQPIVDKLHGAIDKALQNPKVKETLLAQGIEEKRGAPGELGAYLAGEIRRWGDIVKLSAPAAAAK